MGNKNYFDIIRHYENCLATHGDSHLGVDWPKQEDVFKRYDVMLDIIKNTPNSKTHLLDFGCGLAHLYEYILHQNLDHIEYTGLDISPKFIEIANKKYPNNKFYCLDILDDTSTLPSVYFDYAILNGVFTEKRQLSFDEMFSYFKEVIKKVFNIVKKGLAFNVMSKAVDWERDDLFHLSTDKLIDFLTKELSRNFIIRNDYGLYEYTVYLYKNKQT